MKMKTKYYLQLSLSIVLTVVSGNIVKAEYFQLEDFCKTKNPKCDALLYASKIYQSTYRVSDDSKDKEVNKAEGIRRIEEIGWQNVKPIDKQGISIDSHALIGERVIDGKTYYLISFRGTHGATNLMTDTGAVIPIFTNGYKVHPGFLNYTQAIVDSDEFKALFAKIQSSKQPYEILLTGHSLGGAAAQMMTSYLKSRNIPSDNIKTVVFGSPAVGDKEFSNKYLNDVIRAELDKDPVPSARNPLFTEVDYGTKIKLNTSRSGLDSWNRIGIHMEYDKEIERLYEQERLKRIAETINKNNTSLAMNDINSCYTSQGSSPITSASCYVSRPPEESLYFSELKKSLPINTQEKNQYTDGTIVKAPIDITLQWNYSTQLDLDSHLVTPNESHVYFNNRGNLDMSPNAFLYRDSIPDPSVPVANNASRTGAEQTRITTFQNGEYRFYVHNYSESKGTAASQSNNLSTSAAKVNIYEGGSPLSSQPNDSNSFNFNNESPQNVGNSYKDGSFSIPTTATGNTWYVFKLNTRTGILTPVNRFGSQTSTTVPNVR